jgi:DNA-binding transcriptional ArsR family regulator
MKSITTIFRLLSDELRIRILMLLQKKELSVCQIMGITGASQPLVSRNLSLLSGGGFLVERRAGKLRYYGIRKDLAPVNRSAVEMLKIHLKGDPAIKKDLSVMRECEAFQKNVGRCDMKTLLQFMEQRKKMVAGD